MGKVKGIEITDLSLGAGDEALKDSCVAVDVRMFLRRGDEVSQSPYSGPRMVIDLGRRECIAGLRYGIPGMRVGGMRQILVPPHLAYGEAGIPGRIPANALLRCEVELMEVRDKGVTRPREFPSGRHLHVTSGGEAVRGRPWWQFFIDESGRCGASFKIPVPGVHWRHLPRKGVGIPVTIDEAMALIEEAIGLPKLLPEECLPYERLWSDHNEWGAPVTRDRQGDSACIVVIVYERGETICYYALHEQSRVLSDSNFFRTIDSLLKPHLESAADAALNKARVRRLPD